MLGPLGPPPLPPPLRQLVHRILLQRRRRRGFLRHLVLQIPHQLGNQGRLGLWDEPAWRSACKALRGRVRCAVVDGRSKLAKDYGVERFPTILYFAAEPGAGQATKRRPPLTYSGARDERSRRQHAHEAGGDEAGGSPTKVLEKMAETISQLVSDGETTI